jgi:hypothetical protein
VKIKIFTRQNGENKLMQDKNTVIFTTEDNEEVEFQILEQTKINGISYILVTDASDEDEEGDAYILKDLSEESEEAAIYDMVDDEKELELVGKIFAELLDDIELE